MTADGEGEIVARIVMMLKGENSRTVVQAVKEALSWSENRSRTASNSCHFTTESKTVDRAIYTVEKNLIGCDIRYRCAAVSAGN